MDAPETILPQNAWDDKIIDVSDVVAPYVSQLSETAKLCSTFYNKATKQRSYYLCPIKQGATPFHIWSDLVEKAGLKMEEIPKNWDGVWTYLKQAQAPLRSKGMRKVYACGLQITTVGPNDGNNLFRPFPDRQWWRGHRHTGRQAAHRRPERFAKRRSSLSSS